MNGRHVFSRTKEGVGLVSQVHGELLTVHGNRLEIRGAWRVTEGLTSRHEEETEQNTRMEGDQIRVIFGVLKGITNLLVIAYR